MTAMRPASAFSSPCSVQIGFPALLKMKTCFLCCFHAADTPPCPSACNREDSMCWAAEEEEQQGGDKRETDAEVGKEVFIHTTKCEHHEQAIDVTREGQKTSYMVATCNTANCASVHAHCLMCKGCLQICLKLDTKSASKPSCSLTTTQCVCVTWAWLFYTPLGTLI